MSIHSGAKIAANRASQKWTLKEQAGRIIWSAIWPLFRFSPRPFFWGWRRIILRACGARIAQQVQIHPTAQIAIPWNLDIGSYSAVGDRAILYSLGQIRIGSNVTVSQGAHLCAGTHDWRDLTMPLRKPAIVIECDVWVCADAYVGPGVTVGERAIVGARAVVVKDVASSTIVVGNPAREVGKRN